MWTPQSILGVRGSLTKILKYEQTKFKIKASIGDKIKKLQHEEGGL